MPEWISVKDRLPDRADDYLVCRNLWGNNIISVCTWTDNLEKIDDFNFYHKTRAGWFDYDIEYGYFEYNDVTHWMELPEAPPKHDAVGGIRQNEDS